MRDGELADRLGAELAGVGGVGIDERKGLRRHAFARATSMLGMVAARHDALVARARDLAGELERERLLRIRMEEAFDRLEDCPPDADIEEIHAIRSDVDRALQGWESHRAGEGR